MGEKSEEKQRDKPSVTKILTHEYVIYNIRKIVSVIVITLYPGK